MSQLQLMKFLFPLLRWLYPKRPRRVIHSVALDLSIAVHSVTWPFTNPALWLQCRVIRWQVRRGTWGVRV